MGETRGSGGCLGKVDAERLLALLRAGLDSDLARSGFVDAEVVDLPTGARSLAVSTDLIYDFGLDAFEFGRVAATHALSDIYASLASPFLASIALGVSRSSLSDGGSALTLAGIRDVLVQAGAALAGGHTVYSRQRFAGITVVGADPAAADLALSSAETYDLVLSKALGSGVYISALQEGVLTAAEAGELTSSLGLSNAGPAAEIKRVVGRDAGGVGFVTDVTGFGLLQALQPRLVAGVRASVWCEAIPTLSRALALIESAGIVTTLGEENMFYADDSPLYEVSGVGIEWRIALNDPQTSGGLLAAVRSDCTSELLSSKNVSWFRIGVVEPSGSHSAPVLSVVKREGVA